MRSRIFAVALLVTCILVVQGATAQGQRITLTFANWSDAEQATRPGIEATIKQFEQENPNITIKSEAISFSNIGHTLVLRVKSGNPPDVAEIAGNPMFQLAETGGLQPLDSYLTPDLKSQVSQAELNLGMYKGKLVAFPWTGDTNGLWYNKKLMQAAGLDPNKPPTTIDELTQDLAAIHKSNPNVVPLGLDTTNRSFGLSVNWPWIVAFGAMPFSGNTANADTPEMKAYLSWMRELAQKGYIETGKKIGEFRPLAAHGNVAFIWDETVLKGVIQSVNGMSDQAFYDTWGVAPQPKGPAGVSHVVNEGAQLVMFARSQHKEAAWKFIQFLATSPYAIQHYTIPYESSLPPLAHPTGAIAALLNNPIDKAFIDNVMPTVTMPPYGASYGLAYSPIMAGVQEAITSNTPIDQIAASMQADLKNALQ